MLKLDFLKTVKLAIITSLLLSPLDVNSAMHIDLLTRHLNPNPQFTEQYSVKNQELAKQLFNIESLESFRILPIAQYNLPRNNALTVFLESGVAQTIDRKLSLEVYALLSAVKVSYSGTLTASVMVNEKDDETSLALSKSVGTSSIVSIQTIESSVETRQMISLALSF